jgi:hypothetical protein
MAVGRAALVAVGVGFAEDEPPQAASNNAADAKNTQSLLRLIEPILPPPRPKTTAPAAVSLR